MYLTFVYMKVLEIFSFVDRFNLSQPLLLLLLHTKNAQDSFFTPITFTFYKEDTNS